MLKYLLLFSFITQLFATQQLSSHYYVNSTQIKLSDIINKVQTDTILYTIEEGRYSKRVKSKELINKLQTLGFREYSAPHGYIKFEKRSPINLSKIQTFVEQYYLSKYENIKIQKIEIHPRGYIKSLKNTYTIKMPKKSELHSRGTLSIRLDNRKQLFFDFSIKAKIDVFVAKNAIQRKEELSFRNTQKKSIILDKFKALPIQTIVQGSLQSKFHIQKGNVLTLRDVEIISLVKRGAMLSVTLSHANMSISFSAKALQSGKRGDTITVQKTNGKKIKAVVIGKNRVEIR